MGGRNVTSTSIILIAAGAVVVIGVTAGLLVAARIRRRRAEARRRRASRPKGPVRSLAPLIEQGLGAVLQGSVDALASWAAKERPSLKEAAAPDGTVTILFSGIENSTALVEELGDQRFLKVIDRHHRLFRDQIKANDGHEVKSQGDGFMVAFSSARRAIDCAVAVQKELENGKRMLRPLRVRIGLHTGEVMRHDGDLYGKNVVMAARVASLAQGGQIPVTQVVKELTDSAGDLRFDQGRDVELRGLQGMRRVYELDWSS
jgi:class 3 adenylate cyclase